MSLSYPLRLLLTVLAYLIARILANWLAWALRHPRPGRPGQVVEFVRCWSRRLGLGELLRLGYYLLVPFVVLRLGWASPLDLGLADLDWVRGVGTTVVLCLAAILLLGCTWREFVRLADEAPPMDDLRWVSDAWGWTWLLREAVLLEASWSLIRAPLLLIAGPYWGVYAALGLVLSVSLFDPRTRSHLDTAGLREDVLLTGSVAIVTATLYALAHNVWLCAAAHVAVRGAVLWLVRGLRPSPSGSLT